MFDFIIGGSGPAALAFLNTLREQNHGQKIKVLVIEIGGKTEEAVHRSLKLASTSSVNSMRQDNPNNYRNFQLGGTSNSWGGTLMPFDLEEFQLESNGVRYWPEDIAETYETFSRSAGAMFGLNLDVFETTKIGYASANPLRQAVQSKMNTQDEILQLADEIAFETAIVDVEDHQSFTKVRTLDVRTGSPKTFTGKRVVLALGGIESNRLVLNSKNLMAGLSAPKLAGSGYSPHLNFVAGLMRPSYKLLSSPGIQGRDLSRFYFTPTLKTDFTDATKVTLPLIRKDLIGYFNSPKKFLWKGYRRDQKVRLVNVAAGHRPTKESNIRLSANRDILGRRGVLITHSVPRSDEIAVLSNVVEMVRELSEGDFSIAHGMELGRISRGKSHHLGGLRIMNSEGVGVVDANLRLQGTKNVFLASSAVFPTFSHANPTLTICALAIRLAKHLGS